MSFKLSKCNEQKVAEVLRALGGEEQGWCYKCNTRSGALHNRVDGVVFYCYKCGIFSVVVERSDVI
jgi:hypothetical protein